MAIFLNSESKVIVQGMTGSEGRKHTQRMLSAGTNFTYEEMVLAITLRVELQLLAEFLLKRRGTIEFAPDLADKDLREVSGYSQNVSAFRSAKAAAKRNWGIPIRSSWFE